MVGYRSDGSCKKTAPQGLAFKNGLKIHRLVEFPRIISTLVNWCFSQLGRLETPLIPEAIKTGLFSRLNRDRIPITCVVRDEVCLIGSFSLKIREMETFPQYPHWLGSAYLLSTCCGEDIGTGIVRRAAAEAACFKVIELHLYTGEREIFYTPLGEQVSERPMVPNRRVVVRVLALPDHP